MLSLCSADEEKGMATAVVGSNLSTTSHCSSSQSEPSPQHRPAPPAVVSQGDDIMPCKDVADRGAKQQSSKLQMLHLKSVTANSTGCSSSNDNLPAESVPQDALVQQQRRWPWAQRLQDLQGWPQSLPGRNTTAGSAATFGDAGPAGK
jgi:hypothetical protein